MIYHKKQLEQGFQWTTSICLTLFDTGPTTVRKFHIDLKEICDLENFKRAISYKSRNLLSRLCNFCIHNLSQKTT